MADSLTSKSLLCQQLRDWYERGFIHNNTLTEFEAQLLYAAIQAIGAAHEPLNEAGGKGADATTAATEPVRRPASPPSAQPPGVVDAAMPNCNSCDDTGWIRFGNMGYPCDSCPLGKQSDQTPRAKPSYAMLTLPECPYSTCDAPLVCLKKRGCRQPTLTKGEG